VTHPLEFVKVYAVQNREGKFFRRKGYGGGGESWTDDPKKARIYTKSGPARSIVTFYANAYPDYGIPSIVEMACGQVTVIDETQRVQKEAQRKADREAKYKKQFENWRQRLDAGYKP